MWYRGRPRYVLHVDRAAGWADKSCMAGTRLLIAAVGKLKDGPERELLARYAGRVGQAGRGLGFSALEVREVAEGRGQSRDVRLADEGRRLAAQVEDFGARVLLDERGKMLDSRAFAAKMMQLRDQSPGGIAFLVGGADGHGEAARSAATSTLSLGPLTLPHGLARIVLAEQIYRAMTILSGHPYHRD
jgi:23S rRNA (pseudouridine1915-N3)-methyltransferase